MKRFAGNPEFKVGIFVLLGIIAFFVFIFSSGQTRGRGYEVRFVFNNVAGLEPGSAVRVSGFRVGDVKDISIIYQETPKLLVTVRLHSSVKVASKSMVTIRSTGIIGEKYVEIVPAPLSGDRLLAQGDLVEAVDPLPLERFMSAGEDILKNLDALLKATNSFVQDPALKRNIVDTMEGAKEMLTQTSGVLQEVRNLSASATLTIESAQKIMEENREKIGLLIADTDESVKNVSTFMVSATKNITETREGLLTAAGNIDKFFVRLGSEGVLSQLMDDTSIVPDIRHAMSGLKETQVVMTDAIAKLNALSDRLNVSAVQAELILSQVRSGKGTVGKLLYDDNLYDAALGLVNDIRDNPWKLLFRRR
ncbi:MAG: MlaD family protein [Candidatus Ratteibacteria bacterium]